jgi:hypothetical protein
LRSGGAASWCSASSSAAAAATGTGHAQIHSGSATTLAAKRARSTRAGSARLGSLGTAGSSKAGHSGACASTARPDNIRTPSAGSSACVRRAKITATHGATHQESIGGRGLPESGVSALRSSDVGVGFFGGRLLLLLSIES